MLALSYNQKGSLQKEVIEILSNYLIDKQNQIEDEDAENAIIYGIPCFRNKDNNIYQTMVCLSPTSRTEICFYNQTEENVKKIYFNSISHISFEHTHDVKENKTDPIFYCQIFLDKKSYELYFVNEYMLLLFVKGLQIISKFNIMNYSTEVNIYTSHFNEYKNDIINDQELKYFARCLGIHFEDFQQKFNNIGNISSQALKQFIKTQLSGRQFQNIFEKYSTLENVDKQKVMGPHDLKKFFEEFQKEDISYLESCQLIIQFNSFSDAEKKRKVLEYIEDYIVNNKNINEKEIQEMIQMQNNEVISEKEIHNLRLYLTLYEFNMMLNSLLLVVYDKQKFDEPLDLDRAINEYFIKSTHNTYNKI